MHIRTLLPAIAALLLASCTPAAGPPAAADPAGPPASSAASPSVREVPVSASWRASDVVTGLDTPWDIAVLDGGGMLVTQRAGMLTRFSSSGTVTGTWTVPGVLERGESGLTGMTPSPDFAALGDVFVQYSRAEGRGIVNRVSRFTIEGDALVNERVIIDGLPGGSIHNGGRVRFGPDGKLWILSGDGGRPETAQDPESLGGKVLRLNADGSVPADNPFPGSPVWSLGHRNPQGLDWHPVTGELFVAEHGQTAHDEVNVIEKGGNYGWPLDQRCEGGNGRPPVYCAGTVTLAPSGIAFAADGSLLVAGLKGAVLRRLVERGGAWVPVDEPVTGAGRLRAVTAAPDGTVLVGTSNRDGRGAVRAGDDRILRLTPTP